MILSMTLTRCDELENGHVPGSSIEVSSSRRWGITVALPGARSGGGLNRQSLSQGIVEEVLKWFTDGRYGPGDLLPTERELMSHFGVSRNSVREAMQALVSMQVIDVGPGRGTRVLRTAPASVLSADVVSALLLTNTLDELYEFRLLLEPGIAARAAENATAADIEAMSAALDDYEAAMDASQPVAPHDLEFHRMVARATGNSIYLKVMDALSELLAHARKATDLIPTAVHSAAIDHRAILEAVSVGDSETAARLMGEHVRSAIRALDDARQLTLHPEAADAPATREGKGAP